MKFFNTAGLKKNKRWPFTPNTGCIHTPATNSTVNVILSELLISSLAMQQLSFRAVIS
ncbi:unnamed protein product [Brassica rapa]|uniref:Uncharacterized protein n=1 Tax=Brassica campestris TaxID=3711 RepID=A0A8D9HCY9_BRACM|nr:unnamed protein product [Brassica rapa]